MKRHSNETTLGDAIKRMLEVYKLKSGVTDVRIQTLWPELMGPEVAKHTQRIHLRSDTLSLTIRSAPLRQELTMQREELIAKLNEALGEAIIKHMIIN